MYIVGRIDKSNFFFAVCNTGEGAKYHPSTSADYPKEKRRCVRIRRATTLAGAKGVCVCLSVGRSVGLSVCLSVCLYLRLLFNATVFSVAN